MKKIYIFENCKITVNIPEDAEFQERLRKASENFMRKVIASKVERKMRYGNTDTTRDFRKK